MQVELVIPVKFNNEPRKVRLKVDKYNEVFFLRKDNTFMLREYGRRKHLYVKTPLTDGQYIKAVRVLFNIYNVKQTVHFRNSSLDFTKDNLFFKGKQL